MLTKLPKDHPLWPVIYMGWGAGCIVAIMFASATDLADLSEFRTAFLGTGATAMGGWIFRKVFSA